jgi:hypothetical protein
MLLIKKKTNSPAELIASRQFVYIPEQDHELLAHTEIVCIVISNLLTKGNKNCFNGKS